MKYYIDRRQSNYLRKAERTQSAGLTPDPKQIGGIPALVCKTSAAGIPARSGAVAGIAEDVVVQTIEPNGTLTDTDREIKVYNPFALPVGAEVYITCKFVNNGYGVVDAEDCG